MFKTQNVYLSGYIIILLLDFRSKMIDVFSLNNGTHDAAQKSCEQYKIERMLYKFSVQMVELNKYTAAGGVTVGLIITTVVVVPTAIIVPQQKRIAREWSEYMSEFGKVYDDKEEDR